MFNSEFFETHEVVMMLTPVNLASQANNGNWVDARSFDGISILLIKAAGTAGQDPTFTLKQAKSSSGQDSKNLEFTRVYRKQGTAADGGDWTVTTQSSSNTYSNGTLAENKALIGVYIRADDLDVQGGFTHLRLEVPDTGSAAQLGAAVAIGSAPHYSGAQMPNL